jgi:pyrroline-5-carboxylate reductase
VNEIMNETGRGMLKGRRIAFVGSGVMGEAIIKGLLTKGVVDSDDVVASDPVAQRREQIESAYRVATTEDNLAAARGAEIVILCVKPQVSGPVISELSGSIRESSLVLSIMAGVPVAALRAGLQHDRIVRSIPNTPAQIGMGATVWTATVEVTAQQREWTAEILGALGEHVPVSDEHYLDMATGLSGSGPGFVFLLIEALIDAGVYIGFGRDDAEKLVLQTMEGSVALMRTTGSHPADLRNRVTSPAGTTAAGLYELEAGGVRAAIQRAVQAAYLRSEQLGGANDQGEQT